MIRRTLQVQELTNRAAPDNNLPPVLYCNLRLGFAETCTSDFQTVDFQGLPRDWKSVVPEIEGSIKH